MRRVALKIAYIGTNFHGYQRQPGYRTVEGELVYVLKNVGIIDNMWDAHYSVAGRTDKGVHAIGNVISFLTNFNIHINQLNGLLPDDIKIIGLLDPVPSNFKVRFPKTRLYKYIYPINPYFKILNIENMVKAAKLFKGTHNYRNFSKSNEKSAYRTVTNVELINNGDHLLFNVEGESFLWHMVRKMITALILVGLGNLSENDINHLLTDVNLREIIRLKPAPAEGLILTNLNYDNITIEEDSYAKNKLIQILEKKYFNYKQKMVTDTYLIDLLK